MENGPRCARAVYLVLVALQGATNMFEIGSLREENQALGTTLQWPGYVRSGNLKCIPSSRDSGSAARRLGRDLPTLRVDLAGPWLDLVRGWMGCPVCQRGLVFELAVTGSGSWCMSLLEVRIDGYVIVLYFKYVDGCCGCYN